MAERETLLSACKARLDAFVASETELSRTQAQRLIHAGAIRLNGAAAKPNAAIVPGDCVEIDYPEPEPLDVLAEDIPLDVLYEDADLLVIDKPQGMVVHPAPGHASGTLVNALLFHIRDLSGIGGALRPGIVHRLDRMTSGLLVVAKNDASHRSLAMQFQAHSARRSYVALVDGNIREDAGTIDAPIARHPIDRKRMAIAPGGREAVTRWRVVERLGQYTLLQLELETGRTHQIRVHLASMRHPVSGDDVYGRPKRPFGLEGQALHGYRLLFLHPRDGRVMTFYAPPPAYFTEAFRRAGGTNAGELLAALKQIESKEGDPDEQTREKST